MKRRIAMCPARPAYCVPHCQTRIAAAARSTTYGSDAIFERRQTESISTSPYVASTASHTCRIMAPGRVISDVSNRPFLILFANSIPLNVTCAFPNVLRFNGRETTPAESHSPARRYLRHSHANDRRRRKREEFGSGGLGPSPPRRNRRRHRRRRCGLSSY